MNEAVQFLAQQGYAVLFAWVLVEQLGLPIPSVPVLFAAGAQAGSGRMNLPFVLALVTLAALAADLVWYCVGRYRGGRVLKLLCRISLEPESCVRRTEDMYAQHGSSSLLVAKFVPGLRAVAPPLAGIFRMPVAFFILFDGLGALFWATSYAALGYMLSPHLEQVANYALRWSRSLAIVLVGSLVAYMCWKYVQRQRFLHRLRIARITAQELMERLTARDEVMVVDLRLPLDVEALPYIIPGALRMAPEELEKRHQEIPRDRDIVLYCS